MSVNETSNIVKSLTDLSQKTTTELTDSEVQDVFKIVVEVSEKHQFKIATPENLDALRDEVLTRLMEVDVLATFDPVPLMNGEQPILEIIGKTPQAKEQYGHDFERAVFEARKANERNEDVLGNKEPINKRRDKKKDG